MGQWCRHGREVYCPLCEKEKVMSGESPDFDTLFAEYRDFILAGADKKTDSLFASIPDHHKALGAVGLSGEASEVLEVDELDRDAQVKEAGDVLWYWVLKANAEGLSINGIIAYDIQSMAAAPYHWETSGLPLQNALGYYRGLTRANLRHRPARGMAIAAGKVLDLWKKEFFHTKTPANYIGKVTERLGETFRYLVAYLDETGITMDEVVHENMKKLVMRYPERHPELVAKFTNAA